MVEKNMIGVLILAFLVIVLGSVFLVGISNSTVGATQLNTVVNESVAFTGNLTPVALRYSQLVTLDRVGNASQTLSSSQYSVVKGTGVVYLILNSSIAARTYDVSYTWYAVGDSNARSILNLVGIFFALGVLLALLAVLSPSFRDMIGLE